MRWKLNGIQQKLVRWNDDMSRYLSQSWPSLGRMRRQFSDMKMALMGSQMSNVFACFVLHCFNAVGQMTERASG